MWDEIAQQSSLLNSQTVATVAETSRNMSDRWTHTGYVRVELMPESPQPKRLTTKRISPQNPLLCKNQNQSNHDSLFVTINFMIMSRKIISRFWSFLIQKASLVYCRRATMLNIHVRGPGAIWLFMSSDISQTGVGATHQCTRHSMSLVWSALYTAKIVIFRVFLVP